MLTEADLKPHRVRYWLNRTPEDPVTFWRTAERICLLYRQAASLYQSGIHLVSSDEMTGISRSGETSSDLADAPRGARTPRV